MRAEALSPVPWALGAERPVVEAESPISHDRVLSSQWDRDTFAEEQVRGLVTQIFSAALKPAVQQVVLCGVEAETDVQSLCNWMGEILSEERRREVALVDEREVGRDCELEDGEPLHQIGSIRRLGARIHRNLWLFPPARHAGAVSWRGSLSGYLHEVRKEFEYSIVASPAATVSSKVLELATFTDGVILVLSAQRTRRVTALNVRNALRGVRLLGTVLSDREFPMPSGLYRRL